jgi:UDP-N-acetylmuramate--alanine ligase
LIQLDEIKKVYFIGIGGIGMSALARYFQFRNVEVSGYDKTPTLLTRTMEESGMAIHYEDNVELIPTDIQLVVYTPAIPELHTELQYYRQHGFEMMKRSEVLGVISSGSYNICVAGTHGKTTISTMIAHILRHSEYGCNAFLGGISGNYNTNFWSSQRNVSVIEADEYDRSFLTLYPDVAIISAMDADHLDIYGTEEALQQAFIDFSQKVKPGGLLLTKFGLRRRRKLVADRNLTYSLQNEAADSRAANIRMHNGSYTFDIMMQDNMLQDVVLNMGGMYNIENAISAITVASQLGIENDKIKAAIEDFKGVKRRFEYIVKTDAVVYVDDYAHHPEELKALLTGATTLFHGRKCTIVFQPHLFSRTRDMADEFARSLDLADEVILLPIYPAREEPIEGVTSRMILDRMLNKNKRLMSKDEVLSFVSEKFMPGLNKEFGEVFITAGAGDIDGLIQPIREIIEEG